ncbi:hypothetical protein NKDENANG_02399 [Candidatus Entotheonellaceae bacterium PAL068K]
MRRLARQPGGWAFSGAVSVTIHTAPVSCKCLQRWRATWPQPWTAPWVPVQAAVPRLRSRQTRMPRKTPGAVTGAGLPLEPGSRGRPTRQKAVLGGMSHALDTRAIQVTGKYCARRHGRAVRWSARPYACSKSASRSVQCVSRGCVRKLLKARGSSTGMKAFLVTRCLLSLTLSCRPSNRPAQQNEPILAHPTPIGHRRGYSESWATAQGHGHAHACGVVATGSVPDCCEVAPAATDGSPAGLEAGPGPRGLHHPRW